MGRIVFFLMVTFFITFLPNCFGGCLQVGKEVEHDTRIRRSYKNIRGQHNVPCWEWLGPKSAIFEDIGVRLYSNPTLCLHVALFRTWWSELAITVVWWRDEAWGAVDSSETVQLLYYRTLQCVALYYDTASMFR